MKSKRFLIVSIIFLSLFLCGSSGFSAVFQWGHVSSINYYYDDPTLVNAGGNYEWYRMYASSGIDENYNVYLTGGPLTNHPLEHWGQTWGDYEYGDHLNHWAPESFPQPGNDWVGDYTFWADVGGSGTIPTRSWSIVEGQIKQIDIPENVQIIGDQLVWDSVEDANQYRVRAYTLDSDGYINFSNLFYNGSVADPNADTILFDLTYLSGLVEWMGLDIDDIAISIHSREYLVPDSPDWENSSRYYFRPGDHVAPVPEPATMLLLGTGLVGLAGVGRKKFLRK